MIEKKLFFATEGFLGYVSAGRCDRPSKKLRLSHVFPNSKIYGKCSLFLSLRGYCRKFIAGYSVIARPLSNLLRSNVEF